MSTKKAVAQKAESQLPATMSAFEADAGTGFEQTTVDDFAIPFLVALQKLSPVCDEDSPKFIEGAKPGQIMNTVTERRFNARSENDEFVRVVPCAYARQFIEWKPRESGGGFVAVHNVAEGERLMQQCERDEKNRDILPNGNQLVDTRQHYVLLENPETGDWEPIIMGMSSTQVKVSRKWMTQMRELKMVGSNGNKFTPPMPSHCYRVSTVLESNDQGSWRSFKITMDGPVENPELYAMAKDFHATISAGEANAAYNSIGGEDTDAPDM